ncbi:MAG: hypothetical protein JNM84_04460 [Planctomycetes bacterium]|nr:hypothetical protein [Planctomycetota bacterium]
MLYLARFACAIAAFALAACSSSSESGEAAPDDALPWTLAPSGVLHEDRAGEIEERRYPAPPEWPVEAPERPRLASLAPLYTPAEAWRLLTERWSALGNTHATGPVHRFATNFDESGAALYARYIERSENGGTKRFAHGLAVVTHDESWEARLAQGETPTGSEPGLVALITYAEGQVSGPQWANHRTSDRRARGRAKEILWAEGSRILEKFAWREDATPWFHYRDEGAGEGFAVFWSAEGFEEEHLRYRGGKVDGICELFAADGRLVRRGLRRESGWQGEQDYWADATGGRYERLSFEGGKLHGYQAFYAVAGWPAVETWYEHGVQEGPFRRLHPNGSTQLLGNFRAGKLEGEARRFSDAFDLVGLEHYVRGKKNGLAIEYDWLERELARGTYLEDQRHGTWTSFEYGLISNEPSRRFEVEWRRDQRQGSARLFDDRGRVVLRGQFDGGEASGAWTGFLFDDELECGAEGLRGTGPVDVDGAPQDEWSFTYPNGATAALGAYAADGQRTGIWTLQRPTGEKRAEGPYDDDLRTGEWSFYRADGSLELVGRYVDGRRRGSWLTLDEHGWLMSEERYDDAGALRDSYRRVTLDEDLLDGAPRDPHTKNGLFEHLDAQGAVLARQRFANDAPRD